jgi:uncharacterized RDD family membrane protein YckC
VNDPNPYSAPQSVVADEPSPLRLGGRGERLGAAIIDGLIVLVILLPLMFVGGYFSGIMKGVQPSFGMRAFWALIGFVLFVLVQSYPLSTKGQTWGKKALKLKIVNLDGSLPDFLRLIGLRYGIGQAITLIPFVGTLYALVDSLFIFREDKRCIHDHIAGTRVVVAD